MEVKTKAFLNNASSNQAKNLINLFSTENSLRQVIIAWLHLLNAELVICVNTDFNILNITFNNMLTRTAAYFPMFIII